MKKDLIIIGGIFLALIIAIESVIAFAAYNGNKLSWRAALLSNSTASHGAIMCGKLASTYSFPEASRDLMGKGQGDRLFRKLSELGGNKTIGAPSGNASMFYTLGEGNKITASYIVPCTFDNGDATIKISLIMEDDQWLILGFHVGDPLHHLFE